MKVGDQVRSIIYKDVGLVVGEDTSRCYFLVEFDQNNNNLTRSTAQMVRQATPAPHLFPILKLVKFYYWHTPAEVQVIGKPTACVKEVGAQYRPIGKMVSGCRCAKCNDFNEYVEVPETQVKTWICTPCKS